MISIIIPVYNQAQKLAATNSIALQTFPDWELIVVDDGSKDNPEKIFIDFTLARVQTDKRFVFLSQQNQERRRPGIAG